MALSGTLVTAGYVGPTDRRGDSYALLGRAVWSELLTAPQTTTQSAPAAGAGDPSFTVFSSVDVLVAIGKTPNASTGARYFVAANSEKTIYCSAGDKLAVVAA